MTGLHLVLAGAAVGNGNRGVEALGRSVADAVDRDAPGSRLTILDDGWGTRPDTSGTYSAAMVEFVGVRRSRRWHRPESWAQVRVAQSLAPRLNPVASRFDEADGVLDLSAGDSFTDLYGPVRLKSVCAPKEAALRAGRPLVLLPQTYGPFNTVEARRRAERIIQSVDLAYARDPWSYERLLELGGPDADVSRLRSGVDVAFALEPRLPRPDVIAAIDALDGLTTAGVNVSGLLRDERAQQRFGLAGNYLQTMTDLVRELIESGAHVVLVPHVHGPDGIGESDIGAIDEVRARLTDQQRARTSVLPTDLSAAEVKWCISRLDWFIGSRMHATIAALSTFTPAVGYAYSDKASGVFETCGVPDQVIDARTSTGPDAVRQMIAEFQARDLTRARLAEQAPVTVEAARSQLRDVFDVVRGLSAAQVVRSAR